MQISLSTQAEIHLIGSIIALTLLLIGILWNMFYFFFTKKNIITLFLIILQVLAGILLYQQAKFIQEHKHFVTTCKST